MTSTTSFPRLVGDIGGTNARFGWLSEPGGQLTAVAAYPCAQHRSLREALDHYLEAHGKRPPPWCALGIANPVIGDMVRMTNHHWSFSISELRQGLGLERFLVINDFTALALALPHLGADDLLQVGAGRPAPGAPLGLIGPGTGLGVSGLMPARGGRHACPIDGEGGHVTLAASCALEDEVLRRLRQRFGHVSAERVLSGPGLQHLHQALAEVEGRATGSTMTAADITTSALERADAHCLHVLDLFCGFLGSAAGNLALTLGARGGVYIGGGIVPRWGDWFLRSRFRECFEAKGRFMPYLEAIPTYVVRASMPALLGAARALDELP